MVVSGATGLRVVTLRLRLGSRRSIRHQTERTTARSPGRLQTRIATDAPALRTNLAMRALTREVSTCGRLSGRRQRQAWMRRRRSVLVVANGLGTSGRALGLRACRGSPRPSNRKFCARNQTSEAVGASPSWCAWPADLLPREARRSLRRRAVDRRAVDRPAAAGAACLGHCGARAGHSGACIGHVDALRSRTRWAGGENASGILPGTGSTRRDAPWRTTRRRRRQPRGLYLRSPEHPRCVASTPSAMLPSPASGAPTLVASPSVPAPRPDSLPARASPTRTPASRRERPPPAASSTPRAQCETASRGLRHSEDYCLHVAEDLLAWASARAEPARSTSTPGSAAGYRRDLNEARADLRRLAPAGGPELVATSGRSRRRAPLVAPGGCPRVDLEVAPSEASEERLGHLASHGVRRADELNAGEHRASSNANARARVVLTFATSLLYIETR